MASYDASIRVNIKVDTSQIQKLSKEVGETESALKGISTAFEKIAAKEKKMLSSLAGNVKKSSGGMSTMASKLKSIFTNLFNWGANGFDAMVASFKEGFANLTNYSSDMNKMMSGLKGQTEQLKNSLAVAFAPIISMIVPCLTQLITWLNATCNSVARFFAILNGESSLIKSKEYVGNYSDAGSGGGSTDKKPSDMFEEVPIGDVSDFSQKMKDAIASGDWYAVSALLGEKINECLTSIDWNLVGQTLAEGLNTALTFLYNFISTFDWSKVGLTVSSAINGLFSTVDWGLAGQTVSAGFMGLLVWANDAIANIDWYAIGNNIATLLKNINWIEILGGIGGLIADAIIGGLDLLEGFTNTLFESDSAFKTITQTVLGFFAAWKTIEILSFIQQSGGLIEALGRIEIQLFKVIGAKIADKAETMILTAMYANDFIISLAQTVIELGKQAAAFIASTAAKVASTAAQIAMTAATLAWNAICGIATAVTTALGVAFAFLTSPIGLVVLAIAAIIGIIVLLVQNWDTVKQVALSVWNKIVEVWGMFSAWFSENVWEPFKLGLKAFANFFIGIWNGIVGAFESCINWIIDGINKALEVINALIRAGGEILEYVGITVDFQIPNLNKVSFGRLPMLANGAVIQGGKPFAAILGDQRFGQTNIETPLPTMVQAFRQALAENGGQYGGNYTFVAQLDSRTIFKETVTQDKMFRQSTGRSAFSY